MRPRLWGSFLRNLRAQLREAIALDTAYSGQLTKDKPHNSGLLNGAEVWAGPLDKGRRNQQDSAANASEGSKEDWDTPFVGEEGSDLDLDGIVVVVSDHWVGEVPNDLGADGSSHLCDNCKSNVFAVWWSWGLGRCGYHREILSLICERRESLEW